MSVRGYFVVFNVGADVGAGLEARMISVPRGVVHEQLYTVP